MQIELGLHFVESHNRWIIVPDVFTYNSILHEVCRENQINEAEVVLRRMIERGVNPDKSTYSYLINGFVSQDNLTDAFRLHDEMLHRGF